MKILLYILFIASGVIAFAASFYFGWNRMATILSLISVVTGGFAFANYSFTKRTREAISRIFKGNITDNRMVVSNEMIRELPDPIQRWMRNSGVIGKKIAQVIRIRQKGLMRTKQEQKEWMEMEAEQYFGVLQPSFVWRAKIKMRSLLFIVGRDEYNNGKGRMTIRLLSIFNIINERGEKINQGSAQRWLAEMCWFPFGAISPYIKWEALVPGSARASINYKGVSGSVIFHINEKGEAVSCTAKRYMGGGKKSSLEDWEVLCQQHEFRNGIKIPVQSEVIWKLKSGDFKWLQVKVDEIEYDPID